MPRAAHPARPVLRTIAAAGAVAALALGLAGCAKPVEVTIPDALTEPGTALEFGETARVPGTAATEDGGAPTDLEVGVTVLAIEEHDESFYDQLSNPEEFAGFTPYAVTVQVDLLPEDIGSYYGVDAAEIFGVLDNGEYANYLSVSGYGSVDDLCPGISTQDSDDFDTNCEILLVPAGATLTSVAWDGEESNGIVNVPSFGDDASPSPYVASPITWNLPAAE